MIELNDVLNIHHILIDKFGGSKGIRDIGALEAAINRLLLLLTILTFIQILLKRLLRFLKVF